MKSKEEIEKYLGMKIESNKEEQTRDSSYAMSADTSRYVSKYQDTYTVTVKVLPEETVNALKSLLKDSIQQGDLETAATCHSILLEESTFYKGHQNAIGLDINESMALNKYEAEQKEIAEEQARLKAEQEAKEKAEEQARLKAEQEAKEKAAQEEKRQVEERVNSDEVDYLIEEISSNNYIAAWGKSVSDMDTEIKNKIKTIENKIKELQESIEEPETQRKIKLLNDRIEMLEDTWEIYTQGFDSPNRFSIRNSDANMFRNYRTNYISISKGFELFEKFQNGEEVPELFGQHHRERLEREKEERIRAEQQEKNMLEKEYGLVGIEDSQTLQSRLEEIVSKGIFLGADKDNDKKVAEYEKMKQEYKEAFSEVNEIIKMMPDELTNKIPSKFKKMLEDERDKEYNPNIQEPLEKQELKNETIIILGLIYRDFLCSPDEKRRLQEKDARELQEVQKALEEEIRQKYNPDNIFKNKNNIEEQKIQQEENNSLIVVKEEKWYKKIFNIIKNLFKKNY